MVERVRAILEALRRGEIDVDEALMRLRTALYLDLFYAKLDVSRSLRRGMPEVILAEGKTPEMVRELALKMLEHEGRVLITRVSDDVWRSLSDIPGAKYHRIARLVTIERRRVERVGLVCVVTGGTADIPVAEEAAITAEFFGANVDRVYDVGVAGLHRLFDNIERIARADVVIVCAGMDAALFSVVAGLVEGPVIAVPTSVGYGSHVRGLAALLSALNSCVPGVLVVNIDNGFGAGYAAALIVRKIYMRRST